MDYLPREPNILAGEEEFDVPAVVSVEMPETPNTGELDKNHARSYRHCRALFALP
jgi:hypothetical protein